MAIGAQLEERCEAIRGHLLAKGYATDEEIKACYDDALDPEGRLIVGYGALRVLLHERTPDTEQREGRRSRADRVILDALRGASKAVTLTDPIDEVREVGVHPKSLNALIELAERDAAIGYFNVGLEALKDLCRSNPTAERTDLLARAVRELSYQQRVCVWIVTHPGPGLPYPEEETTPDLPAWLSYISPLDALQIFSAHEEVNAGRLAALQQLPRGKRDADDRTRGWGVYLANLASLLNRSAEQLARDHSLAALFAQSYVHGVEQERAMEKAEK